MNKIIIVGAGIAVLGFVIILAGMNFFEISNEKPKNLVDIAGEYNVIQQENKIKVFASFYPYYEFTRNVAGDSAIVEQYLPSGLSAHGWEPRAQEIKSLKDADVFVYNGLGVESYTNSIIDSGEFDSVLFVKASKDINLLKYGNEYNRDYDFDPHIWLDPILVKHQVNNIRDGLIKADPQNRENYEQNALQYNKKLDALDMKIKSSLLSCNKDTFVPFHNAFTYLGDRYNIKIMALGGAAPDLEASAADIAKFVGFVKDNGIKVIFAEELIDPRLAKVIAEEVDAQVLIFSPIEALAKNEIGQGITYIDKMEKNLDVLKIALECQ